MLNDFWFLQFVPSIGLLVLLGIHWGTTKQKLEDAKREIDELKKTLTDTGFLTEVKHDLMCGLKTEQIKQHITETTTSIKDDLFSFLRITQEETRKQERKLERLIQANREEVLKEIRNNR